MKPYDYAHRKGVDEITWERFYDLSAQLAEQLAPLGIDAVVGAARAGLFPATQVALMLRRMLYPASLSRRVNDIVQFKAPIWHVDVSAEVAGKAIAVVDEIADTGETLTLVAERARALGAARVVTATICRHTWANPAPDYTALVTDALIIFPWDRKVLVDGTWQDHPEIVDALNKQQ